MSWKSILHDGRWLRVYVYVRYNSQDENKRVETVSLCVYSILNLFNSSIYYGACQNNDHMRRWVFFNHSEMSTWSSNGLYFDFQRDVLDVKKSIWMFNQQVWSLSSQNGWRFVFSEDRNGMEGKVLCIPWWIQSIVNNEQTSDRHGHGWEEERAAWKED